MAEPKRTNDDLYALRNLIEEAHLAISTSKLPQNRTARAVELLESALALTNDLIAVPPATAHAKALGERGGRKTAERGPEYFRQIANQRKDRRGGRPLMGEENQK